MFVYGRIWWPVLAYCIGCCADTSDAQTPEYPPLVLYGRIAPNSESRPVVDGLVDVRLVPDGGGQTVTQNNVQVLDVGGVYSFRIPFAVVDAPAPGSLVRGQSYTGELDYEYESGPTDAAMGFVVNSDRGLLQRVDGFGEGPTATTTPTSVNTPVPSPTPQSTHSGNPYDVAPALADGNIDAKDLIEIVRRIRMGGAPPNEPTDLLGFSAHWQE